MWGEFDRPMLDELREKGIYVHLCAGSERQLREAEELPGVECRVIRQDSARIYFAAVSLEEPEPGTLPEIRLSAEDDPAELRSRIQERGREVGVINGRLKGAVCLAARREKAAPQASRRVGVHDGSRFA